MTCNRKRYSIDDRPHHLTGRERGRGLPVFQLAPFSAVALKESYRHRNTSRGEYFLEFLPLPKQNSCLRHTRSHAHRLRAFTSNQARSLRANLSRSAPTSDLRTDGDSQAFVLRLGLSEAKLKQGVDHGAHSDKR